MEWETVSDILLLYSLTLPRLMACFVVLPLLSKRMLGGTLIRNGVMASLALFLYPIVSTDGFLQSATGVMIFILIMKEVMIGLLIGFCASIPFWAIAACGFFIDNQRGATLASSINPVLGEQSSPVGILLTQTLITLFFVSGSFLVFLKALYASYISWPVTQFFPALKFSAIEFFFGQLAMMLKLCVLTSAPVIIVMFLTEFGLALVGRFSPQLNVFFLALPIKSAVAFFLLIVYLVILMSVYSDQLWQLPSVFLQLNTVFT